MKPDKKMAAEFSDAAKHLRKCADLLDKIAAGDASEGDGVNKPKRRRICD